MKAVSNFLFTRVQIVLFQDAGTVIGNAFERVPQSMAE